ncbi:hypothetical protein KIN20_026200 [Parelaphostrongylus tenuis]|uniref:Protein kinase domain-containing protein n=1 Tax=Parelaphostrongylus tenuis TaxID=148309 RepID=A0AAD5QXB9_PARTN|nr:hypothetical protein KIN20_026200 [Parelaphostrongylus tenuis]
MELCELGSMRSYVKKNGPLTDRAAAYVLRQIISAVKYMHREGVLHRDLSCGNVLISRIFSPEKISVKLCDFGLATHLRKGETACTVVGTPGYMAPQVFKQEYDQAADVFSLGGVLYTILTANDPPSKGPMRFGWSWNFGCRANRKHDGNGYIQHSNFMMDNCDNSSLSRDWSAMGDRSGRSRERRNSREYTRERRSENDLVVENGRINEQRLRRAVSNPPTLRSRPYMTASGCIDSGFGSKSSGEAFESDSDPAWPLPIFRCGGTRMVTAAGRYIILSDNLMVFEVANKVGLITKIVTVTLDDRGKQQVTFDKPMYANVKQPSESDSLVVVAKGLDSKPFNSYLSMNSHERGLYTQIANAVMVMRGRVDKVVYQRPPQFPSAVAKIMENGSFRIVFRDQRRLVQKPGSRDVQLHFPDGRKEDMLELDTLKRFDEVRCFLQKVESVWDDHIGRFPLSFSTSRDSVTTSRMAVSEGRVPLSVKNTQSQSLLTQRSAPATFDPCMKVPLESSRRLLNGMRFKMNKNNEVCSVESPDGRYLRVSSVSKSKFVYRSHPGSCEQRFHINDDIYPSGAQELFDSLQAEIKRREVQR